MHGYDGCEFPSKHPTVTLVFFGHVDPDLPEPLLNSLNLFFDSLNGDIPVRPEIFQRQVPSPEKIPKQDQNSAFFPVIEEMPGNIVIGVTNEGFYDSFRQRYIFSYGGWDGRGLLSTYRFRTETKGRRLMIERLNKQILKTLAMACGLGSCSDQSCIVSYHRFVEDLDRNQCICERCRSEFVQILSYLLKENDDSTSSMVHNQ